MAGGKVASVPLRKTTLTNIKNRLISLFCQAIYGFLSGLSFIQPTFLRRSKKYYYDVA